MAFPPVKNSALKKTRGNFESMCVLCNNAQIEVQWWEHNIKTFNIIDQNAQYEMSSDACLTGWGATFNGHLTGEHWSIEKSKSHVNVLEIKSAFFPFKRYCKEMYKVSIYNKIDSASTIVLINKQREIFELVKEF